ncbi:hypothetical protein ACEPAI_3087 [Sanghuangporus weigelae]
MDDFSWTDGVRATISTCLPCFSSRTPDSEAEQEQENSSTRRGQQTRYEELEGLLRNDPSDTDGGDAETMSLHSNLGSGEGRRKTNKRRKSRNHKSVRLFGFHLFGRPPIQLSDSENDDEEVDSSRRRRARNRPGHLTIGQLSSAHSSSSADAETFGAFDSDASPLDPTLISQLSPQDAAARAARAAAEHEEDEARKRQEQLEKEERRRKRRERKEMQRRAAMGMSMDGEEFEGFPGSGSVRPPFSPLSPGSLSSIPTSPPEPVEEFGPYVGAPPLPPLASANPSRSRLGFAAGDDGEGEDEADFGGEAYTRKAHSSSRGGRGSDSSRSHSQSQSQTSASRSNADSSSHYYYPYPQQQQMYFSQNQASPLPSPNNPASGAGAPGPFISQQQKKKPKSKSKSKRSSNSATRGTTSTSTGSRSPTSQSTSLPSLDSPIPPNLDAPKAGVPPTSEPVIVQHDEEPRATPQLHSQIIFPADPTNGTGNAGDLDSRSKFPTVGFGGRTTSSGSSSGVFLARRGDD